MAKSNVQTRTVKKKARQKAFIEILYEIGILSKAAEATGIGRQTIYDWKASDPEFAKEMNNAVERGIYNRLLEVAHDSKDRGSASVLIFLGKSMLGLSDRSDEVESLRRQLADVQEAMDRIRLVVYRATKDHPELMEAISQEIARFEETN